MSAINIIPMLDIKLVDAYPDCLKFSSTFSVSFFLGIKSPNTPCIYSLGIMFKLAISTIVLKHSRQLAGKIILSMGKWTIICRVEIMSHILDIDTPRNRERKMFMETVLDIAVLEAEAKACKAFVASKRLLA